MTGCGLRPLLGISSGSLVNTDLKWELNTLAFSLLSVITLPSALRACTPLLSFFSFLIKLQNFFEFIEEDWSSELVVISLEMWAASCDYLICHWMSCFSVKNLLCVSGEREILYWRRYSLLCFFICFLIIEVSHGRSQCAGSGKFVWYVWPHTM